MLADERQKNLEIYSSMFSDYGFSLSTVGWGSKLSQEKRFKVLLEAIPDISNRRVKLLDLGCGLGFLYGYITSHDLNIDYTGIDISPELVESAREHYGDHFEVMDIFDDSDFDYLVKSKFDWVVASGIFTYYTQDSYGALGTIVYSMYKIASEGIAFNSLSQYGQVEKGKFFAHPSVVTDICRKFSPRFVLRHDYMPHDFTVYLFKDADYEKA